MRILGQSPCREGHLGRKPEPEKSELFNRNRLENSRLNRQKSESKKRNFSTGTAREFPVELENCKNVNKECNILSEFIEEKPNRKNYSK